MRIKKPIILAVTIVVTVFVAAISYWRQRFAFPQMEECNIMLYDSDWVRSLLTECGGGAMLLASLFTQFMRSLWVGPVVAGIFSGVACLALCKAMQALGAKRWIYAIALLPLVLLRLCVENNSYNFQGHAAVMLSLLALWLYVAQRKRLSWAWRFAFGVVLLALTYWLAGSAAAIFAFGAMLFELVLGGSSRWMGIFYPAVFCIFAAAAYHLGMVPTMVRAFSPGMYYEWDTTWFMLLYCWIAIALSLLLAVISRDMTLSAKTASVVGTVLLITSLEVGNHMYDAVHSDSLYRTMQQRYYAKRGDWDAILDIPNQNRKTPFTSYRFLALAHKGRLADELASNNPYISYFMENKTLVKREDLELLSDIFYDCRFMGAARRYAFDADMVTPGAFNPYETLRLAKINIAYGDYAVAEKLITQLEKTLYYAAPASALRRFLGDDAAIAADPELGAMRRAIPPESDYMTPKTTGRDILFAAQANPNEQVARQFYRAFQMLTQGHE